MKHWHSWLLLKIILDIFVVALAGYLSSWCGCARVLTSACFVVYNSAVLEQCLRLRLWPPQDMCCQFFAKGGVSSFQEGLDTTSAPGDNLDISMIQSALAASSLELNSLRLVLTLGDRLTKNMALNRVSQEAFSSLKSRSSSDSNLSSSRSLGLAFMKSKTSYWYGLLTGYLHCWK